MKYTLHVPVEQFGFVQVDDIESRDEAIIEYKRVMSDFRDGTGIPDKQWREVLDEYLETGKMANGGDFYENLSPAQKWLINEVKKSKKRAN